jgi:hypothetical protein
MNKQSMDKQTIDNNLCSLFKTGKYSYKLFIKGENSKPIYWSLLKTNIIKGAFYNSEEKMLYFTAEKVSTNVKNEIKISDAKCIKMIDTLTQQIKYLEQINYAFYGHNVSDILVINDDIFININANTLLPITNNSITFLYPFEKSYFLNPEISTITRLPSKIHFKSGYYSLAALIIYCLLNEDIQDLKDEEVLHPIFYTKIYWFLKRCLHKRILLLI